MVAARDVGHSAATLLTEEPFTRPRIRELLDTARSFNDDITWATEPRSTHNTTPTTLEAFAHQMLQQHTNTPNAR